MLARAFAKHVAFQYELLGLRVVSAASSPHLVQGDGPVVPFGTVLLAEVIEDGAH